MPMRDPDEFQAPVTWLARGEASSYLDHDNIR